MREILFRGKTHDGEWVYGDLVQKAEGSFCWCGIMLRNIGKTQTVIPETIGQYTGLTAKGTKIFEGDIVDVEYNVGYVGIAAERKGLFVVVFDNGCFMKKKINGGGLYHFIDSDVCRVVGNAIDNPELLRPSSKPEYHDGDPDAPICPNCRTPLNEMEDCDCGQKIDWSEEE